MNRCEGHGVYCSGGHESASKERRDEKDHDCSCDFGGGPDGPEFDGAGCIRQRDEFDESGAGDESQEAQEGEARDFEHDAVG